MKYEFNFNVFVFGKYSNYWYKIVINFLFAMFAMYTIKLQVEFYARNRVST